jgi:hypothetical protein
MKRILLSCAGITLVWFAAHLIGMPRQPVAGEPSPPRPMASRPQVDTLKPHPEKPLAAGDEIKHIALTTLPAGKQSEKISNIFPSKNKTIEPQQDDSADDEPEDRTVWDAWVDERTRFLIDELEVSGDDVASLDKIAETTGKDIRRLIRDLNATPPRIDTEKFSIALDVVKQRHKNFVSELLDEQTRTSMREFQDKFNKDAEEKFGDDIRVMEF